MVRCLVPLVAALVTVTAAAQTSGFTAKVSFTEAVIPAVPGGPCVLVGQLAGSGGATQLGRVTATSQDCINPRGDPAAGGFSFHNNFAPAGVVLIGESGEQLHARYSGTLTPQPNAPHRIAGLFVITGGTGRYTGATGGGVVSGNEEISPLGFGQGQVVLTGVLSR
ncbi:MAG TPA: hypothetical protein VF169_06560 [Albitalea sp.]|uniref:hypothetical protein n=1 Tax=Piscinibacter sp. TaxID=1903157 RepID=UPI002ED1D143